MIALRDFIRLDTVFFRALSQSTAMAISACTGVWFAIVILNARHVAFAARLLPPLPLAMVLIATVLNTIVFAEALYGLDTDSVPS